MRKRIDEIAREASAVTGMNEFWSLIHEQLEVRGASSILFGVLASKRELEMRRLSNALIWKGSHTRQFFDAFDVTTLFENDLTADHCVSSGGETMFWHDPNNWCSATPSQVRRAEIERDLGLAIGFTMPSSHFYPSQVGGVGVAMSDVPLREFERFWKQEGRELVTLCGLLDAGMRGQHIGALVNLSKREKECLCWLSVGLRPDRIADKLNVGDKSIEKYIAGARRKLKAATRDHAIAKAILLGVIEP